MTSSACFAQPQIQITPPHLALFTLEELDSHLKNFEKAIGTFKALDDSGDRVLSLKEFGTQHESAWYAIHAS